MSDDDWIASRWAADWECTGANRAQGDRICADLVRRHREPHRAYHTLEHLRECFTLLDESTEQAVRPHEVALAIWFHDAVYNTRAGDNEQQSANLAERTLADAGLAIEVCQRVGALVRATQHTGEPPDDDAALLVDIDLGILAAEPDRFAEYERQIREEYAWVPEELFRSERAKILERFLARKSVYATDAFRRRFEAAARRNLQQAIVKLDR